MKNLILILSLLFTLNCSAIDYNKDIKQLNLEIKVTRSDIKTQLLRIKNGDVEAPQKLIDLKNVLKEQESDLKHLKKIAKNLKNYEKALKLYEKATSNCNKLKNQCQEDYSWYKVFKTDVGTVVTVNPYKGLNIENSIMNNLPRIFTYPKTSTYSSRLKKAKLFHKNEIDKVQKEKLRALGNYFFRS